MGRDGGEKVNAVTVILHRMPDAQKGKGSEEDDSMGGYETSRHDRRTCDVDRRSIVAVHGSRKACLMI
jgi:hypothetical protein